MSENSLREFLQAKVEAMEILSTSQVRQMAGCTSVEVWQAINKKELPAIKLKGGHGSDEYLITAEDALDWMVERQRRKNVTTIQAITKYQG